MIDALERRGWHRSEVLAPLARAGRQLMAAACLADGGSRSPGRVVSS